MEPLLTVQDLKVHFQRRRGILNRSVQVIRAVDGVTFNLYAGESIGIVGESGSGKTTLLKAIVGVIEPLSGLVMFQGQDVTARSAKHAGFRQSIQIVLQNPYTALPPRRTVHDILLEPFRIHRIDTPGEREQRIAQMLTLVGLNPAVLALRPEQLSGGQRQRINLTRSLMLHPQVLLCDEPVSALDVSIKAQVLNLFQDLRQKLDLTYIFVAHDLSAVRYICDRVAVMIGGRFVEVASNAELYRNPLHPYTRALLAAVPTVGKGLSGKRFGRGTDQESRMLERVQTCAHYPACPLGAERCAAEPPPLVEVSPGHLIAMHAGTQRVDSFRDAPALA